jgi:hypothetical protein
MATLHFEVDTSPMAKTVDSVKGHVNGVTVAVTAMEAAVIATERASARTICENVDNGFYVLIKSQISQKAVAAYTEMSAKQMTLLQLGKALDNVRRQMEADYNMIARRYAKLFASLNHALETRVRELDRPAMKLAEIKKSVLFDKLKDDSSVFLCASNDAVTVAETALSGKLKQKTRVTLQTLSQQVNEGELYTQKLDSILLGGADAAVVAGKDKNYLPVVFASVESNLHQDEYIDTVYTQQSAHLKGAPLIAQTINTTQKNLAWTASSGEEKQLLRREFVALVEKSEIEARASAEMLRLFDADSWQSLTGSEP